MNKMKAIGALAGLAGLFASAAMAQAGSVAPHSTAVDKDMKTRLFLLQTDFDQTTRTLTVHRGSYDDVVGVRCEWDGTATLGKQDRISVDMKQRQCEQGGVPASWQALPEVNSATVFGKEKMDVTYDPATNVITERSSTPRNNIGVTSSYQREWNLNEGKVCLSAREGQYVPDGKGGETYNAYAQSDNGCYDIPDNDYTRKLRAVESDFGFGPGGL